MKCNANYHATGREWGLLHDSWRGDTTAAASCLQPPKFPKYGCKQQVMIHEGDSACGGALAQQRTTVYGVRIAPKLSEAL